MNSRENVVRFGEKRIQIIIKIMYIKVRKNILITLRRQDQKATEYHYLKADGIRMQLRHIGKNIQKE